MLGWLVLVGFFWGTSGILMRRASCDSTQDRRGEFGSPFTFILSLFKRWKFICAYLYDQTGSALYYYILGKTDLSTAVPIANGLTFVFAGITESLVEKKLPTRGTIEGMILVITGAYICYNFK
jgi:drug/metabolite transporter (DMT)-like permease